ncbi:MAG: hypothetical protein ACR2QK_00535, partial [Acidimicrobiales bacterium]
AILWPMGWKLVLGCGLLVVAGCRAAPAQESAGSSPTVEPPSVTGSPAVPTGDSDGAAEPRSDQEDDLQSAADPEVEPVVEVLADPPATLSGRWPQLRTFGYQGRRATSLEPFELPDWVRAAQETPSDGRAGAAGAGLAIESLDLNWGIDSAALLVAIDGPAAEIARVEPEFRDSFDRVVGGETWLAGLNRGGLASPWELDDLAEAVEWIMAPDDACRRSEVACPFGPEVAFPPPPPKLVVADLGPADGAGPVFDHALPFEVVELDQPAPAGIGTNDRSVTWIDDDGMVYTRWSGAPDEPPTARGSATVAHSSGSVLCAVTARDGEPGGEVIVLRPFGDDRNAATWPVPPHWTIDGLVMVETFGDDEHNLIITADLDDGSSRAVALPFNVDVLERGVAAPSPGQDGRAQVDLTGLPALNASGVGWRRPQRQTVGISVVEERADGWYLVDDATGERRELLRSSHPILSYTLGPGGRHIVATIDGPVGPTVVWVDERSVEVIGEGPAAVGWLGSHPTRVD